MTDATEHNVVKPEDLISPAPKTDEYRVKIPGSPQNAPLYRHFEEYREARAFADGVFLSRKAML